MGPLVAVGAVFVPEESLKALEAELDALCRRAGFPAGEEFKWSPGRDLWMRDNLVEADRESFFAQVLAAAASHDVKAVVAVEDEHNRPATSGSSHEDDVVRLLLERLDNLVRGLGRNAIVIADRPGGGRQEDEAFISRCLETLRVGTRFVQFDHLALVVTTPSRLVRLLQLADLVTGCTTAVVSGQRAYAEPTFELIRPLFRRELGRAGGVGLKLHPDLKYANLYHWLLGDEYIVRYPGGHPLPARGHPYFESSDA